MAGAVDPVADPHVCCRCAGEGESRVLLCGVIDATGARFCRWETVLCADCGGLGVIPCEQLARWERGRLLREDRVARHMTLGEEAERLGISPRALSDREWGRENGHRS